MQTRWFITWDVRGWMLGYTKVPNRGVLIHLGPVHVNVVRAAPVKNVHLDVQKLEQMRQEMLRGIAGDKSIVDAFEEVKVIGEEVFGPHQAAISAGTARIPGFCLADDTGYDLDLALRSAPVGWAQIIRDLFAVMPPNVQVSQVKEKFGGLRFYYGWSHEQPYDETAREEFQQHVTVAENLSYKTCEVCGAPGVTRPHGWITTLCDPHDIEMHAERGWKDKECNHLPGGTSCHYDK